MILDDLRKIAENATPGPWITGGELPGSDGVFFGTAVDPDDPNEPGILLGEAYAPDAEFIATFNPELVVALLDRVETAEQERDEYRDGTTIVKLTEAERALQRVREQHQPRMNSMSALYPEPLCSCQSLYPCPTIRALEDDE